MIYLAVASYVLLLASLVCWVLVEIKMFGDPETGGVVKGLLGVFCGLYAFAWAWKHRETHGIQMIVVGWTVFLVAIAALRVAEVVVPMLA